MFFLADIQFDILGSGRRTDDHAGVYFFARSNKERTAVLRGEQTVGYGLTGLKCDQGTELAVSDLALVRCIAVENGVDATVTLGIRHKFTTVTDQAAGRDVELQTCVTAGNRFHVQHFALALA